MKRSSIVTLGLIPAIAAAAMLGGCGSPQAERDWENCTDQNNKVVNDRLCDDEQRQIHPVGYRPFYHWYYTRGYNPLAEGIGAYGGGFSRPSNISPVRPSAAPHISRGGFGSIGLGHFSGGS
jgi:hypothetical protein